MRLRNENRSGYKRTKVGWIPEEWEAKPLGAFGTFSKGKGISNSEKKDKGYPCITYGEIYTKHDTILKRIYSFIDGESAAKSKLVSKGSILFAGSGETLDEIGKCVAYENDEEAYAGGDIIIFEPIETDSVYISYSLNSNYLLKYRRKLGQGHSVVHIYSSGLKSLYIPLPPLSEQKRIAEILSTWDRAIEETRNLIEAKTRLKKGLIQKLITGRIRFPQFGKPAVKKGELPEGWIYTPLKKHIKCFSGGTPSRTNKAFFEGHIPWIKSGELNEINILRTEEYISEDAKNNSSAKYVKSDTLLYALYGATAGLPAFTRINATINQAVLAILPEKTLNKKFLFFWLWYSRKKLISTYSQGGQPNLSAELVKNYRIPLPNIAEQKEISNAISDVDREIELLKKKEEALKEQKKGLIQKLLTGEVRVKTKRED